MKDVIMKTERIMQRDLNGEVIRQNHKTGMFNANDLIVKLNGDKSKTLGNFFKLDSSIQMMKQICIEENIEIDDVKITKQGSKNGGTWIHPVLFVDLACWISTEFRYKALKWVVDGLIFTRDNSGDSFKLMMNALIKNFPDEFEKSSFIYPKISNHIARSCGVSHYPKNERWEMASEYQLKVRDKIHSYAKVLARTTPNIGTCLKLACDEAKAELDEAELNNLLS